MFVASNKRKIINDPVFGFINIPNESIYDLIQHPIFQRLSRIKQLGMASVVYPGAQHTRFQHSLGAMSLTYDAIKHLREKGHLISPAEENATLIAILLHDVGHGPFSHVLENSIVCGVHHEDISLMLMKRLNAEMNGRLNLAIAIFEDKYERHFLHQLVSSQLDMDRLDYLRRDSFFTGVIEGAIGAARIIKMLEVFNDNLVIEAKGIYSIENFLVARRFMYWQVYLHKTSVAAEKMLINIMRRAKELTEMGVELFASPALKYFLKNRVDITQFEKDNIALDNFINLDDFDVVGAVKVWQNVDDKVLSLLSKAFVERRLFKAVADDELQYFNRESLMSSYQNRLEIARELTTYFFVDDVVSSSTYNPDGANILILKSDNTLVDIASISDMLNVDMLRHSVEKHYLFYTQL